MDDIRDQKEQQIPTAIDVGGSIKGLKMTNNLFVNCLPLKVEGEIENSSFEGNRTILSDSLQEEKTENIKSANEIKKNKNIPWYERRWVKIIAVLSGLITVGGFIYGGYSLLQKYWWALVKFLFG